MLPLSTSHLRRQILVACKAFVSPGTSDVRETARLTMPWGISFSCESEGRDRLRLRSGPDEVRIECGWSAGAEVPRAKGLDATHPGPETPTPGLEHQPEFSGKVGGATAPGAGL